MEVKKNMEAEITIPIQEEYEKLKLLISQGVELYTAAPVEAQRLEDAFIELTKGDTQIA